MLPQARAFAWGGGREELRIESVAARVRILDETARTELEVAVQNLGAGATEALLLLPLPRGAAVVGFDFEGEGAEPSAALLERDEARRTYDAIVARLRDPALLEFVGHDLLRSSVFPVPAGGRQRVRIAYEHVLRVEGERVDYALARSESLPAEVPWRVEVEIRSRSPIATVYSPTHELELVQRGERALVLRPRGGAWRGQGPFLLSYLRERAGSGASASLFTYPDPETGGGYFLLVAALPPALAEGRAKSRREVTLVLDRSGSMAGEKLDQARAAALQVFESLEDGEDFQLIDYATQVERFAAGPVRKDRESTLELRRYLDGLRPGGGTNLHDALLEALSGAHRAGTLPLVLFLTDGLPTVGRTAEREIGVLVEAANPHRRRVFTFGVGHDLNVPLLDRISDRTRALSTYVLPGEDVELAVARLFARLRGPLLAEPSLAALDELGAPTTRLLRDLVPAALPDLYEGEPLVLLGRYTQPASSPLRLRLAGSAGGVERCFTFELEHRPSTSHAFVPRLWAARRIAQLVDEIRQAGAGAPGTNPLADPRTAELAREILRLSTKHGVLSEHTAFLATEGSRLDDWKALQAACDASLIVRAAQERSGEGAVHGGRNFNAHKVAASLQTCNSFWSEHGEEVRAAGVQQVCDRAFYARGGRWIDAELVLGEAPLAPDEVVSFGSERHRELLLRLEGEGRQGLLALPGEILLHLDEKKVLVRNQVGPEGR